jgi:hypothetical protein
MENNMESLKEIKNMGPAIPLWFIPKENKVTTSYR